MMPLVQVALTAALAAAQGGEQPRYLRDRGSGLPTSMFATYIRKGELLVYPFFEYYYDNNFEYKPAELGYGLDQDFRGRFRASEELIFVSYGISDRLAVELEASTIQASLRTSPADPSPAPAKIDESGVGDIEGQVRFRWTPEAERRPEVFSYFEAVSPQNRGKPLIATADWEFKLGTGVIKGFSWGTVTLRLAGEYSVEESALALGEYAVEYVRRLSPSWRVYLGVEGTQDEVELITEAQWHISRLVFLKLNNAFALTSKATDWAPEVGLMFSLP